MTAWLTLIGRSWLLLRPLFWLLAPAFCLLALGCSYNPGYVPYEIPGGPIIENHAKPGGPGYWQDFDPKACKLEVTPNGMVTAPLGSEIVLVGTVTDRDGQPRRSRRIDWVVEGPGNIIEVDEAGWVGRGWKRDNKYAVSFTNYLSHTITRGNSDRKDDVNIGPGQTFCVLKSSVPGETAVTAYAPGVFNWDNHTVTVRIQWGDGRFLFPPPAVTRCGSEYTLTTTINNAANTPDTSTSGYRIRYRVIDGPPVVLATRTASGVVTGTSAAGAQEVETAIDANGSAAVQLVHRDKSPGKTRVEVAVLKPADAPGKPEVVVAKRDTVIEWADPKVQLSINAPKVASVNGTFPVTIVLENESGAASQDAQVRVTLSDGATLARSEPPPLRQDINGGLQFSLPPVAGKASQTVTLEVKPAKLGQVTIMADAVTKDGLQASQKAQTRIDQGKLQVVVQAPGMALAGEPIPFRIAVTNGGAAPAENVNIWAQFDAGLSHASPQNPVELSAGTISPGQTKTLDLPLTAKATGHYTVRATATGDGNLTAKADPAGVDVQRAELTASVSGPAIAYLNTAFDWTVMVTNTADTTVSNVLVRAALPPEVKVTAVSDSGKIGPSSIEWKVGDLKPKEQRPLKVSVQTLKLSSRSALTVAVLADAVNGSQLVGDPVGAKAEAAVVIIGTPVLSLDVATPPAAVEVGKRLTFKVVVKNQGTVAVRKIEVTGIIPPELKGVAGTGPVTARIDPAGQVVFPVVDELLPGATQTFLIEVEGAKPGDARFRAEVKAAHLTKPLAEEQMTRVTGK